MAKQPVRIVYGHGSSVLEHRLTVPPNTYIITVSRVNEPLADLFESYWKMSTIMAKEPLFENDNTSKTLTKFGKDVEGFIKAELCKTGRGSACETITIRNHLPGDTLPDSFLSLEDPDRARANYFGIYKKTGNTEGFLRRGEGSELLQRHDCYLSEYVTSAGPGVYILLVCRSTSYYTFSKEYDNNAKFKSYVIDYLTKDIPQNPDYARFESVLHEMVTFGVTKHKDVLSFLKGDRYPSLLTLSKQDSDVTDDSEHLVREIRRHKEKLRADILTATQEGDTKKVAELNERLDQMPATDEHVRTASYNRLPLRNDEIDGGTRKRKRKNKSKRKTKLKVRYSLS